MTEALEEDKKYTTCLRDQRKQQRRRGLDNSPEESMTTMEASVEEDELEGYNNYNIGVGEG